MAYWSPYHGSRVQTGVSLPIPYTLQKCSLIVNLIAVNAAVKHSNFQNVEPCNRDTHTPGSSNYNAKDMTHIKPAANTTPETVDGDVPRAGGGSSGGANCTNPTLSTSSSHGATTQKVSIIFGNPTSLANRTPNFFVMLSSHCFCLPSHLDLGCRPVNLGQRHAVDKC